MSSATLAMPAVAVMDVSAVDISTKGHSSLIDAERSTPCLSDHTRSVIKQIESQYHDHPGYRHFLWDFMATGSYDLDFLRRYALFYYEHVRVFRLYLAGAMTVVPVEKFQVTLSEIIADEFGVQLAGEPKVDGHPELFRRFMRSLGLSEEDWEGENSKPEQNHSSLERSIYGKGPNHAPNERCNLLEGIKHYKDVHFGLFRSGLTYETVGAIIFGMERTTPHRHSKVLEGLEKFQQANSSSTLKNPIDWQFFSEHVGVDEYHNTSMIEAIEHWFHDPVKVQRMIRGARMSFDAREEFLNCLAQELGVPRPDGQLCKL